MQELKKQNAISRKACLKENFYHMPVELQKAAKNRHKAFHNKEREGSF